MILYFYLDGEPRGKQRPRVANGHAYTPQETREYEQALRNAYEEQNPGKKFDSDASIQLRIHAYYKIPKSATKKQREMMLNYVIVPSKKPDIDNVLKIVADSINGVAYDDDKQINAVVIEKFYSDRPRVVVWLTDEGINSIA